MNDYQKRRFSHNMVRAMFNTISGKKIAVFGFAFKKDTGDTRETAAVYVMKDLLEERANLAVYGKPSPVMCVAAVLWVMGRRLLVICSASTRDWQEQVPKRLVLPFCHLLPPPPSPSV